MTTTIPANDNYPSNADLNQLTADFWQPQSDRPLCAEDGRQMVENVRGFFLTLADWAKKDVRAANDNDPAAHQGGETRDDT